MAQGGKREGAGRKAYAPEDKRVQMVITIHQETRARLKEIAKEKGVAVGRLIDSLIEHI